MASQPQLPFDDIRQLVAEIRYVLAKANRRGDHLAPGPPQREQDAA